MLQVRLEEGHACKRSTECGDGPRPAVRIKPTGKDTTRLPFRDSERREQ